MATASTRKPPFLQLLLAAVIFGWSAWRPHDRFTWWLEVAPVAIGVPVLALTRKRFPFTPLVYWLIAMHCAILMVGGHYTYARVPLFDWIRDAFGLARNHFDRLGHLAQGFVPAMIAREYLLRRTALKPGGLLFYLVVSVCLAISAGYELVEWGTAVATGTKADDFLGTQGDPWDTQMDMLLALVGSVLSQLLLAKWQDRQIGILIDMRKPDGKFTRAAE